jgi:hypothetical protein
MAVFSLIFTTPDSPVIPPQLPTGTGLLTVYMAVFSLIFTTPDSRPRHSPPTPDLLRCIPSFVVMAVALHPIASQGTSMFCGWSWLAMALERGGKGAGFFPAISPAKGLHCVVVMADHAWRCIPLPAKGLHCFVVMAGHGAASHWRDRKGGAASHISIAIINERAQLARRQSSLSAFLLPIFPEFDLVHDLVHARLGK